MFYERRRDMSQSAKILGALGVIALSSASAQAAIVATFGEATAPSSNIITSYVVPGTPDSNGWFNSGPTEDGWRLVSESFTVPAGTDYTLDKITMRLNASVGISFPTPAGFSIDIYQLADPTNNPVGGTIIAGQTGTMQPTTSNATAGSYFTFDLDNTVTLQAGVSYAYVLGFDNPAEPHKLLRMAIGAADGAGSRAWQNSNGGGWINAGATYTYYIQGSPVPEPATGGLILAGLGLLARRVRR